MYDVAIAGAGIGGAVLGLALARRGLKVAVLEQARQFAHIYRGEFLQPRSLAILQALGLAAEIEQVTVPVHQIQMRRDDGKLLGAIDYQALTGPVREGRNGHHRAIQAAVLRALEAEPGATLQMGARVIGLRRGAGGQVTGLETTAGLMEARLTVGADGQNSAVRKHAGISAEEYRYPGEPLAVTVELEEPAPPVVAFVFGTGQSGLMFPLPDRKARLYLVVSDAAYGAMRDATDLGLAQFKERLAGLLPAFRWGIERIPDMSGVQRVPCWYLRAERWVGDGVALLGDAVHAVSPTRGQGMNLAIQDAAALADLLPTLPRDRAVTAADLAPYERSRRSQADFIQRDAGRVHRLLLARSPLLHLARDIWLGAIARAPQTMARILPMYAGTVRPPVWSDHLFVTMAVAVPRLDPWVARTWGSRLQAYDPPEFQPPK